MPQSGANLSVVKIFFWQKPCPNSSSSKFAIFKFQSGALCTLRCEAILVSAGLCTIEFHWHCSRLPVGLPSNLIATTIGFRPVPMEPTENHSKQKREVWQSLQRAIFKWLSTFFLVTLAIRSVLKNFKRTSEFQTFKPPVQVSNIKTSGVFASSEHTKVYPQQSVIDFEKVL